MIIWKYKHKPQPKIGDVTEHDRFALVPVQVNTGDWVWLETVTAVYQYEKNPDYYQEGYPCSEYSWNFMHFRRKI